MSLRLSVGARTLRAIFGAGRCLSSACFSCDSVHFSEGRVGKRGVFLGVERTSEISGAFFFLSPAETDLNGRLAILVYLEEAEETGNRSTPRLSHICMFAWAFTL